MKNQLLQSGLAHSTEIKFKTLSVPTRPTLDSKLILQTKNVHDLSPLKILAPIVGLSSSLECPELVMSTLDM